MLRRAKATPQNDDFFSIPNPQFFGSTSAIALFWKRILVFSATVTRTVLSSIALMVPWYNGEMATVWHALRLRRERTRR